MATEIPAFRLDFRSFNGPRLAQLREDQADIAIHEWTSWLRIRSDVSGFVPPVGDPDDDDFTGFVPPVFEEDGLAVLLVTRPPDDGENEKIGLFHGRLEPEQLARLIAAIEGTRWSELPRPAGGHFTAPTLALRYERGPLLIERSFNARSGNFLEAIAPLMDLLERCASRANKGVTATLELDVAVTLADHDPRQASVRVNLRNRGIGGIVLNDPRSPRPGAPRLTVRVGELTSDIDGVEPDEWTKLQLPPLPVDAPRSLILAAGRRLTLDLPWVAPRDGRYLVRVEWQDYEGPVEPVVGQTPYMPLPERGPSHLGAGPYPIRGATFSSRRFVVAPSR